jgi:hypothetical protein
MDVIYNKTYIYRRYVSNTNKTFRDLDISIWFDFAVFCFNVASSNICDTFTALSASSYSMVPPFSQATKAIRESRIIATLFYILALEWGEGLASHPGRFIHPGNTRYPLYRRRGGSQGWSGQVQKNSPPPGFDPRTVQLVASRYTDWATGSYSMQIFTLTLSLLMSYIYGAPCKARNFNVIYMWTYVWQRWKPSLSIWSTIFQHWINAENFPVTQLCVNILPATKITLSTTGI